MNINKRHFKDINEFARYAEAVCAADDRRMVLHLQYPDPYRRNPLPDGIYVFCPDKEGSPLSFLAETYQDNKLEGLCLDTNSRGQLDRVTEYHDNHRNGIARLYCTNSENPVKDYELMYKDGEVADHIKILDPTDNARLICTVFLKPDYGVQRHSGLRTEEIGQIAEIRFPDKATTPEQVHRALDRFISTFYIGQTGDDTREGRLEVRKMLEKKVKIGIIPATREQNWNTAHTYADFERLCLTSYPGPIYFEHTYDEDGLPKKGLKDGLYISNDARLGSATAQTVVRGKTEGFCKVFSKGHLSWEENRYNNRRASIRKYNNNGVDKDICVFQAEYKDGKQHGIAVLNRYDGEPLADAVFKDGVLEKFAFRAKRDNNLENHSILLKPLEVLRRLGAHLHPIEEQEHNNLLHASHKEVPYTEDFLSAHKRPLTHQIRDYVVKDAVLRNQIEFTLKNLPSQAQPPKTRRTAIIETICRYLKDGEALPSLADAFRRNPATDITDVAILYVDKYLEKDLNKVHNKKIEWGQKKPAGPKIS